MAIKGGPRNGGRSVFPGSGDPRERIRCRVALRHAVTPFALFLSDLRRRHGLRQEDLAALVGHKQSYVSALESGRRGPPGPAFVLALINILKLGSHEQAALDRVLRQSRRRFQLPVDAGADVYAMVNELFEVADRLHPAQVRMMLEAIRLPQSLQETPRVVTSRLRRRRTTEDQEAKM